MGFVGVGEFDESIVVILSCCGCVDVDGDRCGDLAEGGGDCCWLGVGLGVGLGVVVGVGLRLALGGSQEDSPVSSLR